MVVEGVEVSNYLTHWNAVHLSILYSDMYKKNPDMCSDDAMSRPGGSVRERRAGYDELKEFAEKTFHALTMEQPDSSLNFMCRLDIGVMMNPATERFEYFVNEVERGNLICLFGVIQPSIYRFADEIREVLLEYLDDMVGYNMPQL